MFLLHPHPSMGGLTTTWFVDKGDKRLPCGQRVEDKLAALAAPDLDDIGLHRVIFVIAQADGDICPRDRNRVIQRISPGAGHLGGWVIRCDRQFYSSGYITGRLKISP